MAFDVVRSKAAVLLFLIVTPIVGFFNCSMFFCALLYVKSSFAIILMGKREPVALLCLPNDWDCCVALLHDATGLSAVCNCVFSLSYSLF